jgi:hypothetical protein
VDDWTVMRDEPSLLEQTVAISANNLRFDENGVPVNARAAEVRAAHCVREYVTGAGRGVRYRGDRASPPVRGLARVVRARPRRDTEAGMLEHLGPGNH